MVCVQFFDSKIVIQNVILLTFSVLYIQVHDIVS